MEIWTKIDVNLREKLNPYLAPMRRKRLNGGGNSFTIISNNCWAGHVYRYFGLPYNTPTVGIYFFADDYIRFVSSLHEYLNKDLKMISLKESIHYQEIMSGRHDRSNTPIGRIGDVEIVFLHYKTDDEALTKWNRRKSRMNMDNLIVKMSEMNGCTLEHLKAFDRLPFDKKFVFTTKDYGLDTQIIFKEYMDSESVKNDTSKFRKYVNLENLINGLPFKKNQ